MVIIAALFSVMHEHIVAKSIVISSIVGIIALLLFGYKITRGVQPASKEEDRYYNTPKDKAPRSFQSPVSSLPQREEEKMMRASMRYSLLVMVIGIIIIIIAWGIPASWIRYSIFGGTNLVGQINLVLWIVGPIIFGAGLIRMLVSAALQSRIPKETPEPSIQEKIEQIDRLKNQGLISEEEFEQKKKALLERL